MVLEIKCWIVNHFKQIEHVFLVLDARKCCIRNLLWNKFHPTPPNLIFFYFYEMLDEFGAFKRIQNFVRHCKFCMLDEMLDPFKSALRPLMDGLQISLMLGVRGEQPCGLRHCNQNRKVPCSNPTRCLTWLKNPTVL